MLRLTFFVFVEIALLAQDLRSGRLVYMCHRGKAAIAEVQSVDSNRF